MRVPGAEEAACRPTKPNGLPGTQNATRRSRQSKPREKGSAGRLGVQSIPGSCTSASAGPTQEEMTVPGEAAGTEGWQGSAGRAMRALEMAAVRMAEGRAVPAGVQGRG